jgi:GDPmannose 4,6-dehydratase
MIVQQKIALIIGVTGQDGAYLAKSLIHKNYQVIGTTRDVFTSSKTNLIQLGIFDQLKLVSMSVEDFRSVLTTISQSQPHEIYNLSGQTSVGISFERPVETIESIANGTLNILEAIRFLKLPARFYNAGSGECFGDADGQKANEFTPFSPRSPYAVAKVTAANLVNNYQESYDIFACTGILFNHESPLRSERFVTQKIIHAAARIKKDLQSKLHLGNIDISRDWGWAPDYVEAMWMMLQKDTPQNYVIATGRTVSLQYFIEQAFSYFDLDWQQHVFLHQSLSRPSDIKYEAADPTLSRQELGWSAEHDVDDVIENMCEAVVSSQFLDAK